MKLTVKIEDRLFEVEVGDLDSRPVVAVVEGETFEVWPETGLTTLLPAAKPNQTGPLRPAPAVPTTAPTTAQANSQIVYAPIPGVIISVAVKPGDSVHTGDELCVLEAMKMKNVIRAPHDGRIESVAAAAGEHVKHHDVLMKYAD